MKNTIRDEAGLPLESEFGPVMNTEEVRRQAYAQGVADGRRTVENEFAADRAALAELAGALAAACNCAALAVHPDDSALMAGDWPQIEFVTDASVRRGSLAIDSVSVAASRRTNHVRIG